ncbi:MAG: S8 family serine peptidase [Alistipes sp.]|nr:S8 family serine peptidase [Alistipes sp.]
MNSVFKYLTLGALSLMVVSCVKDIERIEPAEQTRPAIIAGEDAAAGEIIIKFKPEMEEILAAEFTRSGGKATRSGIPSTDEVLDILGAYSFERVFPVDERHEERTREAGLHMWYLVRFDEGEDLCTAYERLAQLGEIEKLQYNHTIHRSYNPEATAHFISSADLASTTTRAEYNQPFNDPGLYRQWCYINRGDGEFAQPWAGVIAGCDAGCEEAWKLCTGDEDIIVAVMDEAVMWSHPDLEANIWINEGEELHAGKDSDSNGYKDDRYGYNFVRNTAAISWTTNGSTGHGTHVAGTIAAMNDNGIGVAGIAGGRGGKGGVKIMSLQIFDGMNAANLIMEARAMKYAADNGAVILQCSWGYNSSKSNPLMGYTPGPATEEEWAATYPLEKESLDYFIHNAGSPNGVIDGGLAIFASGNEYAAQSSFPAAYSKCISVAALAADFTPSSYTNYGPEVLLSAPGGDMEYYGTPGQEDAQYDEQGIMCEQGGIFSTLVLNGVAGYGYYEGTSMACPHISGIAALGLSYAKAQKRHFTSAEFRKLMYDSAEDIDQYMHGEKLFYMNHTSAGATPTKMNLSDYRGKMGRLSDAGALLKAIDGSGRDMRLPNLYLEPNATESIALDSYIEGKAESVSVAKQNVAKAEIKDNTLVVTALGEGQTALTLHCSGGEEHHITVTVRVGASDNGWF